MNVSPDRTKLLHLNITPAKIIVSHDINSWNQTNLKQHPQKLIKNRSNSKPTHHALKTQQQVSNLASLREKRLKIMQSSSKKKIYSEWVLNNQLKTYPLSTHLPNPQKSSHQALQKQHQLQLKLTQVEVSEFTGEEAYSLKPVQIKCRLKPTLVSTLPMKTRDQHLPNNLSEKHRNTAHRFRMVQNKATKSSKWIISKGSLQEQLSLKNIDESMKTMIFKTRRIVPSRLPIQVESLQ